MRILYLDIDTLRPDHLGCYGYHRNTSPAIDSIAAEGIRFDNCYCSDAPCLPSRTALMSGRFGIHTGVVGHGGTAADPRPEGPARSFKSRLEVESLPGVLSSNGYRTAYIGSFPARHGAWGFYAGFGEMVNTGRSGMESADEVAPAALEWLERNAAEDNWFLMVNLWDPHTPYRVPASFGNPFAGDPLPAWLTQEVLARHRELAGAHKPGNVSGFSNQPDAVTAMLPDGIVKTPAEIAGPAGLRQLFDGYDIGVRYADDHVKRLLQVLERKGVLQDTAVIVSSDHGENLGELGIYAEHGTADQATTRVPLIIRWPGGERGLSDTGLHYHLDLAPTLAEMLGLEPPPIWDGRSFAATITMGEEGGRDYLVITQCAHVCQRAVRFGKWLYIRSYHDGFHLFPREMLFDIETDPYEQTDLAAERPEVCREAVYLLNEWHDQMMGSMTSDVDRLWTVMREGGPYHARGALPAYRDLLRATGRGEAAEELGRRYPQQAGETPPSSSYARDAYVKNLFDGFKKKIEKDRG
jgi:choline-sulfatase